VSGAESKRPPCSPTDPHHPSPTDRTHHQTSPPGGWDLNQAPALAWSDGDLWNVTLDLDAGTVYEYKYVVMNPDGRSAAAWQSGGNSVVALQWGDAEVEVYDNWWV
jgi:hypothetical protein